MALWRMSGLPRSLPCEHQQPLFGYVFASATHEWPSITVQLLLLIPRCVAASRITLLLLRLWRLLYDVSLCSLMLAPLVLYQTLAFNRHATFISHQACRI
jgi:hypothetical protein